ncbi:TetR/AcrR family transcriptional regulator [Chachezhania sediminis]|uniref:TetR/AcrR family transcriptional regulator n=1 Tax=Chachezhania sediminis TaxID=2599291 RepID=UPI00131EA5CC|nr:TetR/AcrR family transcriptional regulator [Chachezhania sediminis]
MASKRRVSRLSPEKRTADILKAAREVFAERGYQDTIMSEIAERAGIVEGSIYRYFRNKRDLMFRMAEDWFEEMILSDETTLQSISGVENRLRFIIHRHLLSIHNEPDLSRLVFQHLRPDPDYRQTKLFDLNRTYTARVTAVIRDGMASGEIRPGVEPTLVRDIVFGSIEHRTWAFLRHEGDFAPEQLADSVVALVWNGLKAPEAEASIASVVDRLESAISALQART